MTPALAQQFGIDVDAGVAVLDVIEGGPADRAGLVPGDVIIEFGGEQLETAEDLLAALRQELPGNTVSLTVLRDGERGPVDVTLGDLPSSN